MPTRQRRGSQQVLCLLEQPDFNAHGRRYLLRQNIRDPTKSFKAPIAAGEKLGLNCRVLHDLLDSKRGNFQPAASELKELYSDLISILALAHQFP